MVLGVGFVGWVPSHRLLNEGWGLVVLYLHGLESCRLKKTELLLAMKKCQDAKYPRLMQRTLVVIQSEIRRLEPGVLGDSVTRTDYLRSGILGLRLERAFDYSNYSLKHIKEKP